MIKYINGDIIKMFCKNRKAMILQQRNCTANKMNINSFTFKLSNILPFSNPYKRRCNILPYKNLAIIKDRPEPGSILILSAGDKEASYATVCCLFAQYKMGLPNSNYYMKNKYTDKTYINFPDDCCSRIEYFENCLIKLLSLFNDSNDDIRHIDKIAIPRKIGCHSAGGDWKLYKKKIVDFAYKLNIKREKKIYVYIVKYNT